MMEVYWSLVVHDVGLLVIYNDYITLQQFGGVPRTAAQSARASLTATT